jgi:ribosomal protein S18 acetylase RimI-like enzyme
VASGSAVPSRPSLRKARREDISAVAAVHLASFQNFFLTFLGRAFLERLYLEVLGERGAVFWIAESADGALIGFAAGVPDLPAFYRRAARQKWFAFGLASLPAVLRRPAIIPRLWRALRAGDETDGTSCPATLMSIAVAPAAKGAGTGKALIAVFLGEMGRQGALQVCLLTDRDHNEATIGFYEGLGFQRTREYQTREGRWIREYLITCR